MPPPLALEAVRFPPRVPQVAAGKLNLVVAHEILKGGNLNAVEPLVVAELDFLSVDNDCCHGGYGGRTGRR